MTRDEEKQIQLLNQTLNSIREENKLFRDSVTKLVEVLNHKIEQKHLPISLEQSIVSTTQSAIGKVIGETLGGYNSPLALLIKEVVISRSPVLREIITSSFDHVIALPEFKQSIVTAFSHKVAKSIIQNNDGLFDKVSNELKQDSIFKSKMQLAVSKVVEECLQEQKQAQ